MKPTIASTATTSLPDAGRIGTREDGEGSHRQSGRPTEQGDGNRSGRPGPKGKRPLTLAVAAQEYVWLYDSRHGTSCQIIANRDRVSVHQVRRGIKRAAALEAKFAKDDLTEQIKPGRWGDVGCRLVPLFPIGPFTPQSACPHHEAIERGSRFCCMVCHASGMDDHPGLRRDPQTDPAPEPDPAPAPAIAEADLSDSSRETRRQRRRRRFAESAAVA